MDFMACCSPSECPNMQLFGLWVDGKSVEDAAKELERSISMSVVANASSSSSSSSSSLLLSSSSSSSSSSPPSPSSLLENLDKSGKSNPVRPYQVEFTFARRGKKLQVDNTALRLCEVSDQFNFFLFLEHYLCNPHPSLLSNTQISYLTNNTPYWDELVGMYWSFSDAVIKDVTTRQKFSSGYKYELGRKDLEELCATTGFRQRSVNRQVGNIRNVCRMVEEATETFPSSSPRDSRRPPLVQLIMSGFCLKKSLAVSYASAAYLMYSKFMLAFTNPTRFIANWDALSNTAVIMASCLNSQSYDFHNCVLSLAQRAEEKADNLKSLFANTSPEYACLFRNETALALMKQSFLIVSQLEPDRALCSSVRDVKNIAIENGYTSTKLGESAYSYLHKLISASFPLKNEDFEKLLIRMLIRMLETLLLFASNLNQQKEFQHFLLKMEKICLPMLNELNFSPSDVASALTCCAIAVHDMLRVSQSQIWQSRGSESSLGRKSDFSTLSRDWLRFVAAVRLCTLNWIDSSWRKELSAAIRSI